MRVLILTHERSGGMNLLMWLSTELSYDNRPHDCYHEPYNNSSGPSDLFTNQNVLVKEFPEIIESNCQIPLHEFINTFDYVIRLIRNNTYDTSISQTFMGSPERGNESVHNIYDVDKGWIDRNQSEILTRQKELEDKIEKLKSIDKGILVSYENIYENKSDIDLIKDYIRLNQLKFEELLNNKYKLRGGRSYPPQISPKRPLI